MPPSSQKKPPAIRAGVIVSGPFGPLTSLTSPKKRSDVRGLVLKGHTTQGQWLVHWFSVGKTSSVSFSKITVISGSNTVQQDNVANLLKVLDQNYIGTAEDLIEYVDKKKSPILKRKNLTPAVVSPASKVSRLSSPSKSPSKLSLKNCPTPQPPQVPLESK